MSALVDDGRLLDRIPADAFLRAFPFYFAWNATGVIVETGPSLAKVCPDVTPGRRLTDAFRLIRPRGELSAALFREKSEQLFIVEDKSNHRLLRGGYLALPGADIGVLLGTPWITHPDQLTSYGLTIDDFAVHDQTLDLLLLLQTHQTSANDLRQLNATLIEKRARLLEQEESLRESEAEARQQRDEARRQRDELEWIYNNASVGLCFFDRDLRYKRVNRWIAELDGHSIEEHIGRNVRDIAPACAPHLEEEARAVIRSKRSARYEENTAETPSQPGVMRYFNHSWHPIFGVDGEVSGLTLLVEEITDQRRVRALADADRRKNEFLATLAHELRNPLAPIKGALQLLQMTEAGDSAGADNQAALRIAERQVDHLVRLVDDLLEVARITHGKIELRMEEIDLLSILPQAVDLVRPPLEKKRHRLDYDAPEAPLTIRGDRVRLVQIFANLLDNAIKYTPEMGALRLAARCENGHAIVTVSDNGQGIPREKLASIFDLFSQVEYGPRETRSGIGIGLALARNMIELHGGRIHATSEGFERGSEFEVSIPLVANAEMNRGEG
jgi:PAS domain S-box-containing protein